MRIPYIEPGDISPAYELLAQGMSRASLRRAVAAGDLWRVRQGWYSLPGLHPDLLAAGRVGGTVSCDRALGLHRVWMREGSSLHVRVCRHARALRTPNDSRITLDLSEPRSTRHATIHWTAQTPQPRTLLTPLSEALSDLRQCGPAELYLVALECAMYSRPHSRAALRRSGHPVDAAGVDGICESGTEALLWLRLRSRLPLRRQVQIPGIGRVDFVVGDRLIIEVDSRAHHERTPDYERDRRRDAAASTHGYRVLRFTYRQVFDDWRSVEEAIMAAYLRGDHL
ncbi:MAG: DUF559 domain-containing protein [Microcella sp.]|uniref:DUF559 domain-containing protein n=1 Tax=Microcella sp. TaxID=1913979 RepID=UPI0033161B49